MDIIQPKKGRLLIADPTILNDNSFKRSIILLTEHTPQNTIGFIINRPLQYTLNDLLPDLDCSFTIYQGGPVEQDNLYFIHTVPEQIPGSIEISNGIYWGGNFEILKILLNQKILKNTDIRFFLGYAGWEAQQLENEINNHSWFVTENDYDHILSSNTDTIWKEKLLQKGGEYLIWANAPSNVQLN
ncbi:YqgE/AlgH family protein [Tenacibaculum sp. UWU-22]|uniref:YqgE/AlgH family protein n=1 Tax=Tenacibaculum sp. UWU-22 TaxID=3234187 RepID=UPI0034DB2FE5